MCTHKSLVNLLPARQVAESLWVLSFSEDDCKEGSGTEEPPRISRQNEIVHGQSPVKKSGLPLPAAADLSSSVHTCLSN